MSTVRYATLCYPSVFLPETSDVKVGKKTTASELFKEHKGCYRVSFWTRTEQQFGDELLLGPPKRDGKDVLNGRAYTLAEMKARRPALDKILISNVEINRWKGAVECITGNWQPWDDSVEVECP